MNAHATSLNPVPNHLCRRLLAAVQTVKAKLEVEYAGYFPGEAGRLRHALAQAEAQAWETPFPHLFFPDLAEAQVMGLAPARVRIATDLNS